MLKNVKLYAKRSFCIFAATFTLLTNIATPYYEGIYTAHAAAAGAAAAGYTTWEVWQMIMLSLGVTVSVQDSSLVDEACTELKDCFDAWVDTNGFDELSADGIKNALAQCIAAGTSSAGAVMIYEEVWDALRGFVSDVFVSETVSYDVDSVTADDVIASAGIENPSTAFQQWVNRSCSISGYTTHFLFNDNGYYFMGNCGYAGLTFLSIAGVYAAGSHSSVGVNYLDSSGNKIVRTMYIDSTGFNINTGKTFNSWSYSSQWSSTAANAVGSLSLIYLVSINGIPYVETPDIPDVDLDSLATDICIPSSNPYSLTSAGGYDVLTQGRTYEDEAVSGDVVITMPEDAAVSDVISGVAAGTTSWVDALTDAGVIAVDTTADRVIDDSYPDGAVVSIPATYEVATDKDAADEDDATDTPAILPVAPAISSENDITERFPFCIPFDLVRAFKRFSTTESAAPVWEVDVQMPLNYTWHVEVDMSDYSTVVKIFRTGQVILFIIGLLFATRKLIKWGE